eukprot:TRINITY_DN65369_c0_g1_i1.p1 TRINITY_DN65369_c0_g1~~TRINITY_DN65369_c0_g1_i1.p1  ORF type:complete len:337 (+),score=52.78 TRINITY_DN65369_c0_g1_i1:213-1223(+)
MAVRMRLVARMFVGRGSPLHRVVVGHHNLIGVTFDRIRRVPFSHARESAEMLELSRRGKQVLSGLALAFALVLAPSAPMCRCQDSAASSQAEDEDEDDEFDFEFAKPMVTSASMDWNFAIKVHPGNTDSGSRPLAEVKASSTFSLPVERGWPRDVLEPEDVALAMRDTLADRIPRWVAEQCDLELTGAPPMLRGLRGGWPSAEKGEPCATLRLHILSLPLPPMLTIRLLREDHGSVRFELGGLMCAGSVAVLRVCCAPVGVSGKAEDEDERLDLRLVTCLTGFPVAGRCWGLVGCGGKWWWESYRLPFIKQLFQGFHEMVHENMMMYYVAALKTKE